MIFNDDIILCEGKKYKVVADSIDVSNYKTIGNELAITYTNAQYCVDNKEIEFITKTVFSLEETLLFTDKFIESSLKRFGGYNFKNKSKNLHEFLHILAYENRLDESSYSKLIDGKFRRLIWANPQLDPKDLVDPKNYNQMEDINDPCYNKDVRIFADKLFSINAGEYYLNRQTERGRKDIEWQIFQIFKEMKTTKQTSFVKQSTKAISEGTHSGKIYKYKCDNRIYVSKESDYTGYTIHKRLIEFMISVYMGEIGVGPFVYDYMFTENTFTIFMEYIEGQTFENIGKLENKDLVNFEAIKIGVFGNLPLRLESRSIPLEFIHLNKKAVRRGALIDDRNEGNYIRNKNKEWYMLDFDNSPMTQYKPEVTLLNNYNPLYHKMHINYKSFDTKKYGITDEEIKNLDIEKMPKVGLTKEELIKVMYYYVTTFNNIEAEKDFILHLQYSKYYMIELVKNERKYNFIISILWNNQKFKIYPTIYKSHN